MDCDKRKEKSVQIFIPYERPFILVFWEKEWLVGATSSTWSFFVWKRSAAKFHWPNYPCKNYWRGTSPSTWNFGSDWPRLSEIADFRSIFARSASPVTSSEKVQLSLIGSPLAFQWAQDEHRTLSLSPQRVAQKRKAVSYTHLTLPTNREV